MAPSSRIARTPSARPPARQSTRRIVTDGRAPRAAPARRRRSGRRSAGSAGREEELERPAAQYAVARDEVRGAEAGRARAGVERERGELHRGADAAEQVGRERLRRVGGGALAGARAVEPTTAAPRRRAAAWSPCADGRDERGRPAGRARAAGPASTPSSRSACSTVRSQPAAGSRWPSPARRRTSGAPGRPIARSVTPALSSRPPGGCRASSRAPADSAVVPSTDANTSEVCVTLPTSVRASSTSAPVPEPLSFGARAGRQVVAARDEHERVARAAVAADDAEHVDHRHRAPVGVRRAEALHASRRRRRRAGARRPSRPSRGVARAARRAVGEALDELVRRGQRLRAVERRRAASCAAARGRCARRRAARTPGRARPASPCGTDPGRSSAAARGARAALRRTLARRDRRSRGAPSGNIGFEYA